MLRAVQRCSMGHGAAMPLASMAATSSTTKSMSRRSGSARVPHGNAVSSTHWLPPHSNPRISVLSAVRCCPLAAVQKAASAAFTSRVHASCCAARALGLLLPPLSPASSRAPRKSAKELDCC